MAVFLAALGMLSGALFTNHSSAIREGSAFAESALIPRAQGARIDPAAAAVMSAPFISSNDSIGASGLAQNFAAVYAEGAVKDLGIFITPPLAQSSESQTKQPLSYGVIYQVNAGDTLASIANAYDVSQNRIVQFNPSVNFSALTPGISIIIPGQHDVNAFSG